MKFLKLILFYLTVLITTNLILSILSYFNITNNLINNIIITIILIVTYFLTGVILGKNSYKKIYIEGLKMSIIYILIALFILLITKLKFSYINVIIYILNTMIILLGCKIGKLLKN